MNMNLINLGILESRRKGAPSFQFEILTNWDTTFQLPLAQWTDTDVDVDWGDGTSSTGLTGPDVAGADHTFPETYTSYTITITGHCPKFIFSGDYGWDAAKFTKLLDIVDLGFTHLDFRGCTNLTAISANLSLLDLDTCASMFYNCQKLESIPSGIFDGCTRVGTNAFHSTFYNCKELTTLPADLFKYNTLAGQMGFYYTFNACQKLATIPADLFKYNTEVGIAGFWSTFMDCTVLESVPELLFKYNTKCEHFYATFMNCDKLQLNAKIFYDTGEQSTRFLDRTSDFSYCFHRGSFTGTQGTAPALWGCDFGSVTPTTTSCFGSTGNTSDSLTNYADIPVSWGGPLE